MNKIKILYLIDKMKPAGAQRHLEQVMAGLDKTKFEPKLVTLQELGVRRIYDLSGIRGLFRLVRLIKKERFNIVHTYLFSENILGVIAAKLASVPIIITGRRDTGMLCQGKWRNILVYRLTNPFVTKIVCVSEAVKKVVLKKERVPSEKVEVIYNGVDINKYQSIKVSKYHVKESLGIKDTDLVVGMVANFSWIKGHEVLLKAAPEVIKEVPNAKFMLIGDGALLEKTKMEVGRLRMDKNFLFLGKRSDIPELLSIMDVSLNLSYSEGMSNTILESMAAGVPVVATAVDGNLETVIDNKTGVLIPVKDSEATAQAINRLLKYEKLRRELGESAKRLVRERFNSHIMINRMERMYLGLFEDRKGT